VEDPTWRKPGEDMEDRCAHAGSNAEERADAAPERRRGWLGRTPGMARANAEDGRGSRIERKKVRGLE